MFFLHLNVCVYVCMCMSCVHVHVCACVRICTHTHTHTHTHTPPLSSSISPPLSYQAVPSLAQFPLCTQYPSCNMPKPSQLLPNFVTELSHLCCPPYMLISYPVQPCDSKNDDNKYTQSTQYTWSGNAVFRGYALFSNLRNGANSISSVKIQCTYQHFIV